jgi:hypothetical protein
METLKNNAEGQVNERVEKFDAMPKEALLEKVRNMFTEEEKKNLTKTDMIVILDCARRVLETEPLPAGQELEDALIKGAIARTAALDALGGAASLEVYATDKEGNVVSDGANKAEALRKALEIVGE